MTKEQFEREMNYRIAMALAKSLLNDNVLNEKDYEALDAFMLSKYRPILSGLYPEST